MLIRATIIAGLVAGPLAYVADASQATTAEQLKPGDFVTFILAESGNHPEPRDLNVRLGVGGSAVEQPTDVLIYSEGKPAPVAGRESPGLCASGTAQTADLIDPEGKRPKRTITVITTHPNAAIPPQTKLEEIQVFSKCVDAQDKVYIEYMGTLRTLPGQDSSGAR